MEQGFASIAEHLAAGSPRYGEQLDIPGLRHRRLGRFPQVALYSEQGITLTSFDCWMRRMTSQAGWQVPMARIDASAQNDGIVAADLIIRQSDGASFTYAGSGRTSGTPSRPRSAGSRSRSAPVRLAAGWLSRGAAGQGGHSNRVGAGHGQFGVAIVDKASPRQGRAEVVRNL
jgi:hypothetical protein